MRELKKDVWKICTGTTSTMWDFHAKCVKLGRFLYPFFSIYMSTKTSPILMVAMVTTRAIRAFRSFYYLPAVCKCGLNLPSHCKIFTWTKHKTGYPGKSFVPLRSISRRSIVSISSTTVLGTLTPLSWREYHAARYPLRLQWPPTKFSMAFRTLSMSYYAFLLFSP